MDNEIIKRLGEPFPFDLVEVKIQVTNQEKTSGLVVFYLDSRTIQNRLDEVLGHFGWKNQYIVWQEVDGKDAKKLQKSQLCGIAIYNTERNEWVGKFDGAECSDIEPIKGGLSDSFKRAACMWGIGRYLYGMEGIWVDIEAKGKGHQIKANQQSKLRNAYDTNVKKIFGATTFQQNDGNTPRTGVGSASTQKQAASNPTENISNQLTQSLPATPPQQSSNAQNASNQQPPAQQALDGNHKPQGNVLNINEFIIRKMQQSGKESKLLELFGHDGEITSAYVRSDEQGISVGTRIRNVILEAKSGSFGVYNLLTAFDLVA